MTDLGARLTARRDAQLAAAVRAYIDSQIADVKDHVDTKVTEVKTESVTYTDNQITQLAVDNNLTPPTAS